MLGNDVREVAADVFAVRGSDVNWYLLRAGRDVTLVDAGYPRDSDAVLGSVRAIGCRPEDVAAVLVTHAHADHLGAVNRLAAAYGTPAYLDPAEVPHARREFLHQVSVAAILANAWRPGVLPWALRAVRSGGTADVAAPHATAFPAQGPLDLPGAPVPVPTPGHTDGHTAFHLPQARAVLTGDALVTGHPTSRRTGPQTLPRMFNHAQAQTYAALDRLRDLDADLVLPGHGEPWSGPVATAVDAARRPGP